MTEAERQNLLTPPDAAAILADFRAGRLTEARLAMLLEGYAAVVELARQRRPDAHPRPVETMLLTDMTDEQHRECGCRACLSILAQRGYKL